jgi:hypothetical protein
MIQQLNQFATSLVLTGAATTQQYGVDFGFVATIVELNYDTTGLSFNFSLRSSVAAITDPLALAGEKRTFNLTNGITKLGLATITTATSTAAGGAPQVRVQAWG